MHREKVFIDGVQAGSVTQILGVVRKPFLEFWRGKLGNAKCEQVLKDSQDIGHAVHEAIEAYFQGHDMPELGQNEVRMFQHFKEWAIGARVSPVELELNMVSNVYKFHGTCDAVLEMDGKLYLADWKTSSAMDPFHGAQLAAYAQMYKELTGKDIVDGLIVRMDKKPEAKKLFEVKAYSDLPHYFEVFLACLKIYNFQNEKGK